MKKAALIDDSGVTERKDKLGSIVIAFNILIMIGLTILVVLTFINS